MTCLLYLISHAFERILAVRIQYFLLILSAKFFVRKQILRLLLLLLLLQYMYSSGVCIAEHRFSLYLIHEMYSNCVSSHSILLQPNSKLSFISPYLLSDSWPPSQICSIRLRYFLNYTLILAIIDNL